MRTPTLKLCALGGLLLALSACDRQSTTPTPTENATPSFAQTSPSGDPAVLAIMTKANKSLRARGLKVAVEAIEFLSIGNGRPSNRIHQTGLRWVPGDPRRIAQGDDITFLIATNRGATSSGLNVAQTTAAIRDAFATWKADHPLRNVDLQERAHTGGDVTIFDEIVAGGSFDDFPAQGGNPFVADIVNAGWLPRAYFEAVGGPGGGRGILAFSVTFIFVDGQGNATDINGDNYLDTALNEVYYNNTFGQAGTDRADRPWGINIAPPGIDVETVGLHENGHSLGLGHFGPEPPAVMNPVYAGIRQLPFPPDDAGMNAVWASWPNP
jgi:Matrixin